MCCCHPRPQHREETQLKRIEWAMRKAGTDDAYYRTLEKLARSRREDAATASS